MARKQNNLYTLTHADGHTTQVVASNVRNVARAIHTFKIDAITIQRESKDGRSFKKHKV